jgi:predicted nucleotide-binding protein
VDPNVKMKGRFEGNMGRKRLARLLTKQVLVQSFLEDELGLETVSFEKSAWAGLTVVQILEQMLHQATFAVLVLTGEDETEVGSKRARQNVIHEAGLFQGLLGFRRAVMLLQHGVEPFSNIAGLQCIEFEANEIENSWVELRKALVREGLLEPSMIVFTVVEHMR